MPHESKNLVEVLTEKDQIVNYLTNLEKLKADNSVGNEQYAKFKEDYTLRLQASQADINEIKGELKEQLESNDQEIESLRHELNKLDTKYKVGELSQEDYQASKSKLQAEVLEIEDDSTGLRKLIAAKTSAELGVTHPAQSPAKATKPGATTRTDTKTKDQPKADKQRERGHSKTPIIAGMPTLHGLISPWTRPFAMVLGFLLFISIFLPWVIPSKLLGEGIDSASGMQVTGILGAVGIVFGIVILGTAVFFSARSRGLVQIIVGILSILALAGIIFGGMLPLNSEYARTLMVLGIGFFLYCIAAILFVLSGLLERRYR